MIRSFTATTYDYSLDNGNRNRMISCVIDGGIDYLQLLPKSRDPFPVISPTPLFRFEKINWTNNKRYKCVDLKMSPRGVCISDAAPVVFSSFAYLIANVSRMPDRGTRPALRRRWWYRYAVRWALGRPRVFRIGTPSQRRWGRHCVGWRKHHGLRLADSDRDVQLWPITGKWYIKRVSFLLPCRASRECVEKLRMGRDVKCLTKQQKHTQKHNDATGFFSYSVFCGFSSGV